MPYPESLINERYLSLPQVAEVLDMPYGTAKRRHQRGKLPAPVEEQPALRWSAKEIWRYATYHKRRPFTPFSQWDQAETPLSWQARSSRYGITVTYRGHPQGAITLVYPKHGDSMRDNGAFKVDTEEPPQDGDVIIWVDLHPGASGWSLRILQQGIQGQWLDYTTEDLSRIVHGSVPFWPIGLRNAVTPALQIASGDDAARSSLISVEMGNMVGGLLGKALSDLALWEDYSSCEEAQRDIRIAEGVDPDVTLRDPHHLSIQVRPIEISTPSKPKDQVDSEAMMRERASDLVPVLSQVIAQRWRPDTNAVPRSHPAMESILSESHELPRSQWRVGHYALSAYLGDPLKAWSCPRLPDLFMVEDARGEISYFGFDAVVGHRIGFILEPMDAPFVRTDHGWQPFPSIPKHVYGTVDLIRALRVMLNTDAAVAGRDIADARYGWFGLRLRQDDAPTRLTAEQAREIVNTPFNGRDL